MTDIVGPQTREEHLLNDPGTRGPILVSIAQEALIGVFSRIETISIAENFPMLPPEGTIWRQIRFKPTVKDKDLAVAKFIDEVLSERITHFYRLPQHEFNMTAVVEGNGIVIRCSVELFPKIMLVLDYCGHK